MKHSADMSLDELVALKSDLEVLTAEAEAALQKCIAHYDDVCNRIAMKVGFPQRGGNAEWDAPWMEEKVASGKVRNISANPNANPGPPQVPNPNKP
jgi:hypothetical protein